MSSWTPPGVGAPSRDGDLRTPLFPGGRELQANGVLTGSPQHTDPAHRLIGSIVLDCTAVRVAAWAPEDQQPLGASSLGGAIHPARPAPVIATWDEHAGWCVGLHHDPANSSRRYLHHPDQLPAPAVVAEYVVGLALGQPLGAAHPPTPGRPQLRLVLRPPKRP